MTVIKTPDLVREANERAGQYWFRDGVNEIGNGLGGLGTGALLYMIHRQMAGDSGWPVLLLGGAGLAISMCEGRVKKLLRRRLSYPRIGYVSEEGGEPLSKRRRLILAVVLPVLFLLPFVLILFVLDQREGPNTFFSWLRWAPFVAGPAMFGAAVFDVERFKVQRLWIDGILLAIAGPLISFFITDPFLACCAYVLFFAILHIVTGTVVLVSLVRRVPVAAE